jgi:hypothetical protein
VGNNLLCMYCMSCPLVGGGLVEYLPGVRRCRAISRVKPLFTLKQSTLHILKNKLSYELVLTNI